MSHNFWSLFRFRCYPSSDRHQSVVMKSRVTFLFVLFLKFLDPTRETMIAKTNIVKKKKKKKKSEVSILVFYSQ